MSIARFNVPTACNISRRDIFTGGQVRCAINRDAVVIPKNDQAAKAKVAGKSDRFVVYAFHKAPVTSNYPSAMVNQFVAKARIEVTFGNGHAYGHRKSLPKRTGGAFNAINQEIFGVPCARTAQLAKVTDVIDGRTGISC